MGEMKIGYAQFEPRIGKFESNLEAIRRLADEGAEADLLVFPELATSGYDFADQAQAERNAEPFGDGATSDLARELAVKHDMPTSTITKHAL